MEHFNKVVEETCRHERMNERASVRDNNVIRTAGDFHLKTKTYEPTSSIEKKKKRNWKTAISCHSLP